MESDLNGIISRERSNGLRSKGIESDGERSEGITVKIVRDRTYRYVKQLIYDDLPRRKLSSKGVRSARGQKTWKC